MSWHRPSGALTSGAADVKVAPADAGWAYSGLQVFTLRPGHAVQVDLAVDEAVVVPLSARDVTVTVDDNPHLLAGRDGVFAAVSDWMYVPLGAALTITGRSGEVAVCTARASRRLPAVRCRRRTSRSRCAAPAARAGR